MLKEDEEYEFSCRSEEAIKLFYPDHMSPADPRFETEMKLLQIRLILGHAQLMSPTEKARALNTIKFLKEEVRHAPNKR